MGNRSNFRLMLAALAAALLAGCGALTEQPLPAVPLADAERARFDGAWVGDPPDEVVSIRVSCDGVGHVASLEWDDGAFRMERTEAVFSEGRKGGAKSRFISLRLADKGGKPAKQPMYLLLKYRFQNDDTLVLWGANPEPFAAAIRAGRLHGQVDRYDNVITSPPQTVLDFIDDPDDVRLFAYAQPMVWHKVAGASGQGACPGK